MKGPNRALRTEYPGLGSLSPAPAMIDPPPNTPSDTARSDIGPADTDPFRTADLRKAVLDAWAASPARFREDGNAEEALAIGGYAGRLLIELAANAVDAAREAGIPGRVRFSLDVSGQVPQLRAANVGAPLTAAGVSGLASLRASAKRGRSASVGHFGVGFTAVLAVTDAPEVLSATGGVRFSRADTAAAVAGLGLPDLDQEVAARAGQVPALRLPWPVPDRVLLADPPPVGFTTQVRLPLATGLEGVVADQLDAVGDDLLWALPGLQSIEIERPGRSLRVIHRVDLDDGITMIDDHGVIARYRVVTEHGILPVALLADRPIEERSRNHWQLTWALPLLAELPDTALGFEPDVPVDAVFLGAPTPTDEPISLPARLVGTFPVDDTRRRLAAGRLTEHLLTKAAECYAELFEQVPYPERFALVPAGGFPLGPVDASLRNQIVRRLTRSTVAVTVLDEPVAPIDACVITRISDRAAALLGRAVPGLLPPPRSPGELDAMRVLGVKILPFADATTALAGIDGPPAFWREVYDVLADQNVEDLANLPVPLAGGGRRIGPAGCLLPGTHTVDREVLLRAVRLTPELRVVHPDAAHPLLGRLGAVPADAAALLADPALIQRFADFRAELEDSDPDMDELQDLARLALDLAEDGPAGGGLLDDVVLTDSEGQAWPANELLAPGAPLAAVLAPHADLPMIGAQWRNYPQSTLTRVGVRTGIKIVRVDDVDADLPELDRWWSEVVGDSLPPETFDAIADLDLVDDGKWPEFLRMLAADPAALPALRSGPEPAYSRWWLARFALFRGEPPAHWKLPAVVELDGLYEDLPVQLDPFIAAAIGVLGSAAEAVGSDPGEMLVRLADPGRAVAPGTVPVLTRLVVDALERDRQLPLPAAVRTLSGAVVEADGALVLDAPWFAQVIDPAGLVAGGVDPRRVADVLDLDTVSSALTFVVSGADATDPSPAAWAAASRAAATLGMRPAALFPAGTLRTVTDLTVRADGSGRSSPTVRRVSWWPAPVATDPQTLVTDGSVEGIGRAVAFRAGRWSDREIAVAAARNEPLTVAENGWG